MKKRLLTLILSILLLAIASTSASETYYVKAKSLNIRSGPSTSFPIVGKTTTGARVTRFVVKGEWFRLSDQQSPPLWVKSSFLTRLKPEDESGSVNSVAFELCKSWVLNNTGYQFFVETTRGREYEVGGRYRLQSNLLIKSSLGDLGVVGFDCTVATDMNNKVAGFIQLDTFAAEKSIVRIVKELTMRRLQYGGTACPGIEPWKKGHDELRKGNFDWDYPSSCIFLREGTRTFGFLEEITYDGTDFVKIRLANGKEYWIEPVNY